MVITDLQGRIEYVNPKFTQVTGYAIAEVTGQNPRLLKSGTLEPARHQELWAAITSVVQLGVLLALRSQAKRIEDGHVASAVMVASFSIAIGLLNAVSIST